MARQNCETWRRESTGPSPNEFVLLMNNVQLKEVINQNKLSEHLSPASVKLILQYNQPGMMLR